MFSYHHVKAVEEERFGRHRAHESSGGRRRHISLGQLLAALAGRLDDLGVREGKGKTRPASPAY